mmetsp:Transcript_31615/g.73745  ORF Transcript_31615/g.73745 Transcript_31615/m.73745 type:complete len:226 (+) Transcript_31615:133-810(+)
MGPLASSLRLFGPRRGVTHGLTKVSGSAACLGVRAQDGSGCGRKPYTRSWSLFGTQPSSPSAVDMSPPRGVLCPLVLGVDGFCGGGWKCSLFGTMRLVITLRSANSCIARSLSSKPCPSPTAEDGLLRDVLGSDAVASSCSSSQGCLSTSPAASSASSFSCSSSMFEEVRLLPLASAFGGGKEVPKCQSTAASTFTVRGWASPSRSIAVCAARWIAHPPSLRMPK